MKAIAATAAILGCCMWAAAAPVAQSIQPGADRLSVEQILERNAAARGGLQAWRAIETMTWVGHVQGAGESAPMPFVMELQRPNKTRFAISSIDKRFARIFDGNSGWRVRPGGTGQPDVKAFSKEEADFSREEFVIDGPLLDHSAKGVEVKLAGLDQIEGRKAYLLEVKLPGGASRRVWVDAETFVDFRCDRPSTNPLTKGAPISVYYRDFRSVGGLQMPHTIETRSGPPGGPAQVLVIEKIALNPSLPMQAFAPPVVPLHRGRGIVKVGDDPMMPSGRSGAIR